MVLNEGDGDGDGDKAQVKLAKASTSPVDHYPDDPVVVVVEKVMEEKAVEEKVEVVKEEPKAVVMKKVAIMVVPRVDRRLSTVVLNAFANLPPEWNVQIFHR